MPDFNLSELMQDSGLIPTQEAVFADKLQDYTEAMRKPSGEPGAWDWNKTANDFQSPMVKDSQGNIVAGHHRFIAARAAGVDIPANVVKTIPGVTKRLPRPWSSVIVAPGLRK